MSGVTTSLLAHVSLFSGCDPNTNSRILPLVQERDSLNPFSLHEKLETALRRVLHRALPMKQLYPQPWCRDF